MGDVRTGEVGEVSGAGVGTVAAKGTEGLVKIVGLVTRLGVRLWLWLGLSSSFTSDMVSAWPGWGDVEA
jgi:hypothetical protein